MKKLMIIWLIATSTCFANDRMNLLISPQEIDLKIREVAAEINQEYAASELAIVMIMKGALCVTADLIRHLDIPFTIDFIQASSYGKNGDKRGELSIKGLDDLNLEGKDILVIDDIFDTGHTMRGVVAQLEHKNPKSIKTLVLLVKNVTRANPYLPDWWLFPIDNHFVIGYGLDYLELYRGLPGIYHFADDLPPEKFVSLRSIND